MDIKISKLAMLFVHVTVICFNKPGTANVCTPLKAQKEQKYFLILKHPKNQRGLLAFILTRNISKFLI